MTRQPSIFISHKHSDRKIATELREFIQRTSLGEVSVFQSSDPLAEGPRLGQPLNQELKEALWKTGVVLLVYTTEDQDWSYCMWECGVATNPASPQTRIIVLQCGADTPKVFQSEVRVDVRDSDAIYAFVQKYLTSPDFFPGADEAVAPKFSADGPPVKEAAKDLHSRLMKVIPKREVAEWSPQPFIRLELKTEDIAQSGSTGADLAQFRNSVIVREMDPHASHIFGISKCEHNTTFEVLVKHWLERKNEKSPAWVEDLQAQLVRAVHGETPDPRWTQLPEADGPERYTPVLTRVRQVSTPEAMQFDISLIPFEAAKVLTGIGDPYLDEYRLAMCKIESLAQSLVPYFTPIAARFFNDWSEYVRKILSDGDIMRGPERLEITRKLVLATKKHMLIERVVANPQTKKHSRDWLAFYEEIGGRADIEKTWMLCVDEHEATVNASEIEAAWKFFNDRKFATLFCAPSDVELAIGEAVPNHDVIEVFGDFEYVKLLSLPGGSYTADPSKNVLVTTFRTTEPEDRRLLQSMIGCSTPINEDWLRGLLKEDTISAVQH